MGLCTYGQRDLHGVQERSYRSDSQVVETSNAQTRRWRHDVIAATLSRFQRIAYLPLLVDSRLIIVAAFTLLYLLAALIYGLASGNHEFVFYVVILIPVVVAVGVLHARVRLTAPVLWGLSVWGLVHMLGGTLAIPQTFAEPDTPAVLYNLRPAPYLPKFDQIVHFYGFFIATLAAWQGLRAATHGHLRPTIGTLIAVVCVGMGLGAANEMIEFAAVVTLPETNVGGYMNTGWDLVANTLGCLAAAVVIRLKAGGRDLRLRPEAGNDSADVVKADSL